jgi:hypothetical protein
MESNSYLQSYIEEQRDPLISSLFRRLFEGSYLSKDQLQESFRILNINSDYTSLIVIAIEIKTKKEIQSILKDLPCPPVSKASLPMTE